MGWKDDIVKNDYKNDYIDKLNVVNVIPHSAAVQYLDFTLMEPEKLKNGGHVNTLGLKAI